MKIASGCAKSLAAISMAVALQACNGDPVQFNYLRTIELVPNQSKTIGTPLAFEVKGAGTCSRIDVDWGDGLKTDVITSQTTSYFVDTDASGAKSFRLTVEHTFNGWRGGKTITATAKSGCEGRANTRFVTSPAEFILGFARPGPNQCDVISGMPSIPNRTIVKINTVPVNTRCGGIWYDNRTPHCYDAEGISDLATSGGTETFPFIGLKKFSLVFRIGSQIVQGGTNVTFTTNQMAPFEFCVNEPKPREGVGGYEIHIRADELGPPPPSS